MKTFLCLLVLIFSFTTQAYSEFHQCKVAKADIKTAANFRLPYYNKVKGTFKFNLRYCDPSESSKWTDKCSFRDNELFVGKTAKNSLLLAPNLKVYKVSCKQLDPGEEQEEEEEEPGHGGSTGSGGNRRRDRRGEG